MQDLFLDAKPIRLNSRNFLFPIVVSETRFALIKVFVRSVTPQDAASWSTQSAGLRFEVCLRFLAWLHGLLRLLGEWVEENHRF